jgi:protein-tyrosine kinase
MERLEAAMAKARADRRKIKGGVDEGVLPVREAPVTSGDATQATPGSARPAASTGDWAALRSIDIPHRMAESKRLSALLGPQHSGPYDMLRARIQRQMKEAGWTRIAVTSPNMGCGKTTVSLNLALSMARQPETKVILLDFDLRRPTMAKVLEIPGRDAISALLEGTIDCADYAVRFGRNLAICANHEAIRNSAELLQSNRTGEILDEIEARWKPDVMIFDTPPMQGNDDNLGFLSRVDCTLLVAAAGSTSVSQIDVSEQELAGLTNVVGTVLNKCRYLDPESGYDHSYY